MLLRFSVSNYSSFKDEVVLDMVPAKSRTMKDHIIMDKPEKGKSTEVLPLATIYGANASGKTNLVNALRFMQKLILKGTKPGSLTGVDPFLLDVEFEKKPSRFEIVFKHDNILYTYGFIVSLKKIHEEWLSGYYSDRESKVFERKTDENNVVTVVPGIILEKEVKEKQFIKFLAQGTRPEQLFLTEALSRNIALIRQVVHWFSNHLQIIRPDSPYVSLALRVLKEEKFIDYMSKFLHVADTGINRIQCDEERFDPDKHLISAPADIRQKIMEDLNVDNSIQILIKTPEEFATIFKDNLESGASIKYIKLKTEHIRNDGTPVYFKPEQESDGTRRLMDIAPLLLDILDLDRVFVIDELDRSLHTILSRLFIKAVLAGVLEKQARGQFIMTTHDTNLLDRSLLRRDEIWFMEKDRSGASHLTSLAKYHITEGLNYENGYLNGRFGAIPIIGNIKDLLK